MTIDPLAWKKSATWMRKSAEARSSVPRLPAKSIGSDASAPMSTSRAFSSA